jgi:hypothetical protein
MPTGLSAAAARYCRSWPLGLSLSRARIADPGGVSYSRSRRAGPAARTSPAAGIASASAARPLAGQRCQTTACLNWPRDLLDALEERRRLIFTSRSLRADRRTYGSLAAESGVGRERVRQPETSALEQSARTAAHDRYRPLRWRAAWAAPWWCDRCDPRRAGVAGPMLSWLTRTRLTAGVGLPAAATLGQLGAEQARQSVQGRVRPSDAAAAQRPP